MSVHDLPIPVPIYKDARSESEGDIALFRWKTFFQHVAGESAARARAQAAEEALRFRIRRLMLTQKMRVNPADPRKA